MRRGEARSGFWIEDDDAVEPGWWRCDVVVDGDAVSIVGSRWVGLEGQGVGGRGGADSHRTRCRRSLSWGGQGGEAESSGTRRKKRDWSQSRLYARSVTPYGGRMPYTFLSSGLKSTDRQCNSMWWRFTSLYMSQYSDFIHVFAFGGETRVACFAELFHKHARKQKMERLVFVCLSN
jgi:hypothetical protein